MDVQTEEQEYFDDDGCRWSSYRAYVLCGLLPLCGCADNQLENDILAALYSYADAPDDAFPWFADLPIEGPLVYKELTAHILTNAELIEHGSTVRGSWITDEGRAVVKKLRESENKKVG